MIKNLTGAQFHTLRDLLTSSVVEVSNFWGKTSSFSMFDHKTQQNSQILYDGLFMKDILN